MKPLDVVGKTFGRLTVRGRSASHGGNSFVWADCSCGQGQMLYRLSHLSAGSTRSCGCLCAEVTRARAKTHGASNERIFKTWSGMRQRCTNPNVHNFARYGGKGIKVCARWHTFENFYADMGEQPAGQTIERINGDGDYEPSNCKWATPTEQATNRHTTRFVMFDDERVPMSHASRALGLGDTAVSKRLKRGWTIERALEGRGTL